MFRANNIRKVQNYLNRDPLKHIIHLKTLMTYPHDIETFYIAHGEVEGVLLLLPTVISPYDLQTYPGSQYLALPAANDLAVSRQILDHVPSHVPVVFKFIDSLVQAAAMERFKLERVGAFHSYTSSPGATYQAGDDVVVSPRLDARLLPLYSYNGYDPIFVQSHFAARRAFSCTIYDLAEPVSTCLVYQNYDNIWEIGAVYTQPGYRARGLATQVVVAALDQLLVDNCIPRYQIFEQNIASQGLAEAIGLRRFLTVTHFLHQP
ncbi:MAG TPA: GNAT family N-acetyltransferase [Anaerolineae bacterium]|nr:GNAT family N-acetyltransferase [Anaerolineae bacterium]HMR66245.1 GNAT family N-acetyltransferase [Anaerolineae bacterium]